VIARRNSCAVKDRAAWACAVYRDLRWPCTAAAGAELYAYPHTFGFVLPSRSRHGTPAYRSSELLSTTDYLFLDLRCESACIVAINSESQLEAIYEQVTCGLQCQNYTNSVFIHPSNPSISGLDMAWTNSNCRLNFVFAFPWAQTYLPFMECQHLIIYIV